MSTQPSTLEVAGLKQLETSLKKKVKPLTVGDAASLTGLNIDDAKRVLEALLNKYECRLKVTENGDLIYDFGSRLQLRGEKTFKEYWDEFLEWSWKAFKFVFKIWIVVTLVVYFLVFLTILIIIIIGALSSSDSKSGGGSSSSSSSSSSSGSLFNWAIWDIFSSIFDSRTTTGRTYVDKDKRGYSYQHYEPRPSTLTKIKQQQQGQTTVATEKEKDFIASVYDFVFGPPRVEFHPLENYMELASYLRTQKGLAVKSEIIALAGWTKDEAEDFFAEALARFNGKPEITENGILYGDFDELIRSANQSSDTPIVWFWDEYEAPYEITGNSMGTNVGISFMNTFNLAFGAFFTLAFLAGFEDPSVWEEMYGFWVCFFLGPVPFAFSVIFFLVPFLRIFRVARLNKKRKIQNVRKRLMKVIFSSPTGVISAEALTQAANQNNRGEERLDRNTVEKVMNDLIFDLGGEMKINANGQTEYHFEQIAAELQEIRRLRNERGQTTLGKVIFEA